MAFRRGFARQSDSQSPPQVGRLAVRQSRRLVSVVVPVVMPVVVPVMVPMVIDVVVSMMPVGRVGRMAPHGAGIMFLVAARPEIAPAVIVERAAIERAAVE